MRCRRADVALVAAGVLLAAGSVREITVAAAGRSAADADRALFASSVEHGRGRFGLIAVTVETVLHGGVRIDRACASHLAPPGGRADYRVCAVIRRGASGGRILYVRRFPADGRSPFGHG